MDRFFYFQQSFQNLSVFFNYDKRPFYFPAHPNYFSGNHDQLSSGYIFRNSPGDSTLVSSQKCSEILDPYLVVLNSLPKSALAPLLIVWLGATKTTIIVAGMSVAIFGCILNLYTAFLSTDPEKIFLIYTLGGTKLQVLTKVVIPSNVGSVINAMKVNIGLCLVGVIIGEFLAARQGLGYLIIYASQTFKMEWLLTSLCLLCLMSALLYSLIRLLERRVSR